MLSRLTTRLIGTVACIAAAGVLLPAQTRTAPIFLADDPVAVDDDASLDASGAKPQDLGRYADFVLNTFRSPGVDRGVPALNANTLGEVPDSSWFTNRIGARPMSLGEIVRGPDRVARLDVRHWVVVEGKDTGRQPGFRAVDADDPARTLYQIEFDPPSNPEMATGAEVIGTAIYHAIGYNVVETYLVDLDPSSVSVAPGATITTNGRTRPFTGRDLRSLLRRVARKADGRYRATASRFADGRSLGPFRYYGTRADDPNDVHPHEHRRELRGNRVFAAWLNHDDSRAGNSLDMLVREPGRTYVKHYMFDFGSIMGSGTNEEDLPWAGHEYLVEGRRGLLTLASLGLWRRPFIGVRSRSDLPAAGSFTADRFDPVRWKPHYPNPAFDRMLPEDAFWAARIVAAFTPETVSAIVAKACYSDPRVTDYVTGALLQRRDLVLRAWLTAVNPLADARIEGGVLRFENAAERAGVAEGASEYDLAWFRFDNATGLRIPVAGSTRQPAPRGAVPAGVLDGSDYAGVEVRTLNPAYPDWQRPVRFYFRRLGDGWQTVGVDRASSPEAAGVRLASR